MKSLGQFVNEADEQAEAQKITDGVRFNIWVDDQRVSWLPKDGRFSKIEYKYESDPDAHQGIKVSFLIGKATDDMLRPSGNWQLWHGKPGVVSYSDDPNVDLETNDFTQAILRACDKVAELVSDIKTNQSNWVQYYVAV